VKLATIHDGTPDGRLVVVARDLEQVAAADGIARTLQEALDRWDGVQIVPQLGRALPRARRVLFQPRQFRLGLAQVRLGQVREAKRLR
jgi:hypothetical protein